MKTDNEFIAAQCDRAGEVCSVSAAKEVQAAPTAALLLVARDFDRFAETCAKKPTFGDACWILLKHLNAAPKPPAMHIEGSAS